MKHDSDFYDCKIIFYNILCNNDYLSYDPIIIFEHDI